MPFSMPKIERIETIIDEEPGIYIKRAEDHLFRGYWFDALQECNIAVKISNDSGKNRSHYIFEKVKVLSSIGLYKECRALIEKELSNFKRDFSSEKFYEVQSKLTQIKGMDNLRSTNISDDKATIKYFGNSRVQSIYLIGEFTGWTKNPIKMNKGINDIWSISLDKFTTGMHYYKFIVDGKETLDVLNPFIIKKDGGYTNLFVIERPSEISGDKLTHEDGCNYIGQTKNGEENGVGLITAQDNKFRYYGEFKEGNINGAGVLVIYKDDTNTIIKQCGRFENNSLADGISILLTESNTNPLRYLIYIGKFNNGGLEGIGQMVDFSEMCWIFGEGTFTGLELNGKGKIDFFSEKLLYEGDILFNKQHGYGKETFNLNQKYEGEFKNGKFDGQGTFTWQNGEKYNGQFVNGAMQGRGKYFIPDVGEYVGEFYNNSWCGQGTFTYQYGMHKGARYEGEFKDNMFNGKGKFTNETGEIISGTFINSEFIGTKTSSSACFLTTAMCEILGKDDDCYELQTMRDFRDNYLLKTDNGRELINEYYTKAPKIVDALHNDQRKTEIAELMYNQYIRNVVNQISLHRYQEAIDSYKEMVSFTEKQILM